MGVKYTAIPNSTYTKSIQQKMKNKRSGLRAGLPDLVCAFPGTGVVWIELKRTKLGRVSPVQQAWIDTLNACPGNQAYVCKGFEEAKKVLESYIIIKPSPAHQLADGSVF